MDKIELNEKLAPYRENSDIVFLYEEWGDTPYLKELFGILDAHNPDWSKENELGSWAAEFMLDLLEELDFDLEEMDDRERVEKFREMVDERYDDFRSGHQFARVNNIAIRLKEEGKPDENICSLLAENGEHTGFPVLL